MRFVAEVAKNVTYAQREAREGNQSEVVSHCFLLRLTTPNGTQVAFLEAASVLVAELCPCEV